MACFLGACATIGLLSLFVPTRPIVNTASGQRPRAIAGVTGYEVLSYGVDVAVGNTGVLERACPPEKMPLGGGFYLPGAAIVSDPGNVHVMESSPRVTARGTAGWRVVAWNRSQDVQRVEVWVICAYASP